MEHRRQRQDIMRRDVKREMYTKRDYYEYVYTLGLAPSAPEIGQVTNQQHLSS